MADLVDGVKIRMAGKDYVAPPLSLKQVRTLREQLGMVQTIQAEMPSDAQIDAMVTVVHAGLSRNYPDLTKEQVEDGADLGNLRSIIPAILGASGLVQGGAEAGNL